MGKILAIVLLSVSIFAASAVAQKADVAFVSKGFFSHEDHRGEDTKITKKSN